eukprot:CAMPEP_0116902110 /NCGR_PEP_ID=MMETSP0467-20121206/9800_1 /TAXON_ID=283647 /ORGANISM="Mesodinium pulex, Strain SPMC105" /LENGTH=99 /DNA_ID=CAMNT_0004575845 /DNA_START=953 /DNA_END=1252 /DNA_ORIENTATION=+
MVFEQVYKPISDKVDMDPLSMQMPKRENPQNFLLSDENLSASKHRSNTLDSTDETMASKTHSKVVSLSPKQKSGLNIFDRMNSKSINQAKSKDKTKESK